MALGLVYTAALAKTFGRLFESLFSGVRPVAYSRFVPDLFHDLALLLRDSSIASVIAAPELMRAAQQTMMTTFEALLPFGFAVLFYVGVGLLLIYLGKLLGWALARAGH
ncbi:MAG: hypothetical protein GAK43_01173 [Stenotrophomonas maltophilia]|nr:MAG: hypothetical protein GAK43_01173 [Stenotrophomonas maltophilia]